MIIRLQLNNLKKPGSYILNCLTVYIPCSLNEIYNHYTLTSLARLNTFHHIFKQGWYLKPSYFLYRKENDRKIFNEVHFEKFTFRLCSRLSHVYPSPIKMRSDKQLIWRWLITTFVSKNSRRCKSIDALIVLQSVPKHPYISQRI